MEHLSPHRRLKKFSDDQDGSATIEFVFLFPLLMMLLLMSVEIGVMTARSMMLDRGIDVTMRDLRLGALSPMTHAQMKTSICRNAVIIPNCEQSLSVELDNGAIANWSSSRSRPVCADKSKTVKPILAFNPGTSNELMVVAACATFNPFFPTTGLAANMKLDGAGEYALVATSAFVNEP